MIACIGIVWPWLITSTVPRPPVLTSLTPASIPDKKTDFEHGRGAIINVVNSDKVTELAVIRQCYHLTIETAHGSELWLQNCVGVSVLVRLTVQSR